MDTKHTRRRHHVLIVQISKQTIDVDSCPERQLQAVARNGFFSQNAQIQNPPMTKEKFNPEFSFLFQIWQVDYFNVDKLHKRA